MLAGGDARRRRCTSPELYDPIDRPTTIEVPPRLRARPDGALRLPRRGDGRQAEGARMLRHARDRAPRRINAPGDSEYFVDHIEALAHRPVRRAPQVFGGGLRVTTSLDLGLQRAAEAGRRTRTCPTSGAIPDAALVVDRPATGQILAMVGGRNWEQEQGEPRDVPARAVRAGRRARRSSRSRWPPRCRTGYDLERLLGRARHDRRSRRSAPTRRRAGRPVERRRRRGRHFTLGRDRALGEHGVRAGDRRSSGPRQVVDMAHDLGHPVAPRAVLLDHARHRSPSTRSR